MFQICSNKIIIVTELELQFITTKDTMSIEEKINKANLLFFKTKYYIKAQLAIWQ